VADRALGLHRVERSLGDDPAEVKCMFGLHFQNMFSPCALTDSVVGARNSYYKVILHKVPIGDEDRLGSDFLKDKLFVALSSMQNGKSSGLDGLPCEYYKAMWNTMGIIFVV
jgi:hypothetical protein